MDLKSGYPFWAVKNGLMSTFPPLDRDIRCEVAVLGAGITGALIADEFAAHGHETCVVDQRDVAWGSTAASTALLQYEIDVHLRDLAKRYGLARAVLAYRACAEAIELLGEKAREVRDVDFAKSKSLYYASARRHRASLEDEFAIRRKHGLQVEWLERADVEATYGFQAPCAILSSQAARVDPYRMASRLLQRLGRRGVPIHDRTVVSRIVADSRGAELHTAQGHRIACKYLVVAAGYEGQRYLSARVARNRSSYAFITDPIDTSMLGELADTMMWESARPYLYLRTTGDGRLLVGGEDDAIDIPAKRDLRVTAKAGKLVKRVREMFPGMPIRPAFSWAGTFAETRDGLPWFGSHPEHGPRVLFAMAYGGNGITYSMLGAGLLRAIVERKPHPLKALFGFARA